MSNDRYRVVESADNPETVLAREVAALRRELHDLRGTVLARSSSSAAKPVWLPAGAFGLGATTGAPTFGVSAFRYSAWFMDPATIERLAATWGRPAGWSDVDLDVYWTHESGSASGDVRWRVHIDNAPTGAALNAHGPTTAVTVPASGQFVLVVTRVLTAVSVPAADIVNARVSREGDHVDDTFTADASFLGLRISKAA